MLRHKTIMLYGTYSVDYKDQVEKQIAELVVICLDNGFRFVTRGGAADLANNKWPERIDGILPIDNVVIEAVHDYCTDKTDKKKYNIKELLRTYEDKSRSDTFDIGQEMLQCPARRYEMYDTFLEDVDIFVFIGGGDGVLRLGLVCHYMKQRFLAITAFGRAAAELGHSFYDVVRGKIHYQNLRREDCLKLGSPNFSGEELYKLVRKNLQSSLWFGTKEVLSGKLEFQEYLRILLKVLDNILGVLGRIAVTLAAVGVIYLIYSQQIIDIYTQIREFLASIGQQP